MNIVFTYEEKQFIKKVARLRTIENEDKGNIPEYSTSKSVMYLNEHSKWLISTAAEAAVVKACGLDLTKQPLGVWGSFWMWEHKGIYDTKADVNLEDRCFEVRRVNKRDAWLPIRPKDVDHKARNVKVFIDHTFDRTTGKLTWMSDTVEIMGWIEASEGWNEGFKPNYGKGLEHNVREVPQEWLHDFAGAME